MHSDATSFAAAFKRMRAAGKHSESALVSTDVHEPVDAGGAMQVLQREESDSAAALQMQLQVTISQSLLRHALSRAASDCDRFQAIRTRARSDHLDWPAASSSISPIAPVVLELSPALNASVHIASASSREDEAAYTPADDLHTPSSSSALLPNAAETVYRLHRVSPYRYVDTPHSTRCPLRKDVSIASITLPSSFNVSHGSVAAAGLVLLEGQKPGDSFDDGAVSPKELHFLAPSSAAASPKSSPRTSSAVQPAIFSFSSGGANSAAHLSNLSLRLGLDETVYNLIIKARARRRVQAQLMRAKLSRRVLCCIVHEWHGVAALAGAADGLSSVKMQLVAQRYCSRHCAVVSRSC